MNKSLAATLIAAVMAVLVWYGLHVNTQAPDLAGDVASLSYNFISPEQQKTIGTDTAEVSVSQLARERFNALDRPEQPGRAPSAEGGVLATAVGPAAARLRCAACCLSM